MPPSNILYVYWFQVETATNEQTKEQPQKVSILEEMSLVPDQDEIDELIEPEPQTSSQQPVQPVEKQGNDRFSL